MSLAMKLTLFQGRQAGLILPLLAIPRMMAVRMGMAPWMKPIVMVIHRVVIPSCRIMMKVVIHMRIPWMMHEGMDHVRIVVVFPRMEHRRIVLMPPVLNHRRMLHMGR